VANRDGWCKASCALKWSASSGGAALTERAARILPSEYGRLGFESVTGRADPLNGPEWRERDWLGAAVRKIHEEARRKDPAHADLVSARKRANELSRKLKEATSTLIAENSAMSSELREARERAERELERFASFAIRAKLDAVWVSPPNPPALSPRGVRFEAPADPQIATALAKQLVQWWLYGGGVDGKSVA
jgi:hypothetical protein